MASYCCCKKTKLTIAKLDEFARIESPNFETHVPDCRVYVNTATVRDVLFTMWN